MLRLLFFTMLLGLFRGSRVFALLNRFRNHVNPLLRSLSTHSHALSLSRRRFIGAPLLMLSALSFNAVSASTVHAEPIEYFRKDYLTPDFIIPDTFLSFKLSATETIVTTTSKVHRKASGPADLILDGEDIKLLDVKINGVSISAYTIANGKLSISKDALPATEFELQTVVQLNPSENLALSGLYASGKMLCTQCEAMGFRRITYFLDRPDVLTKYKVRLEGNKASYPILLSNGNLIDQGEDPASGTHWTLWEDPFPKPSYLFALVAGDLGFIKDSYITSSGRKVELGIYSDKENVNKLAHAMYSIKESMRWDEVTFGLECDLDLYNIVATNDFNMGAMENKGIALKPNITPSPQSPGRFRIIARLTCTLILMCVLYRAQHLQ